MSNINKNSNTDTEATTHPSVYRDTVNGRACQNVTGGKTCDAKKSNESNEDNWDLYPNMIRKVENEGSAAQVEHLHELERTCSQ